MALFSPLWASEMTRTVPAMPRALGPCRKASREPCGPVSTTDIPGTCLQPRESQPIAVAMAAEAACPSLRHFT